MSCLCDRDIFLEHRDFGLVEPFDAALVQPASYELTFDGTKVYQASSRDDLLYRVSERHFELMRGMGGRAQQDDVWQPVKPGADFFLGDNEFCLRPGQFYIASSREILSIPPHLMARFEGKSTLGRVGMMVHITAGYVDPGFHGNLTLEIVNVAPWPIIIKDGDKIGQLSFHKMSGSPTRPYGDAGNHYQGQRGPTLPR